MKRYIITLLVLFFVILISIAPCFAQAAAPEEGDGKNSLGQSIKYLAAAFAVGLCAIATGIAQSRIGAAGMGAIVEKPETTGTVIICLAIPETMVILGFVVAAMIILF